RRRQFSHRRPEETECFEPRRGAEQARKRLIAGETPAVEHERAVQQLRREREIVRDHEQRGSPTSRSCPPCSLEQRAGDARAQGDRKSTRLNSSHGSISYAVFCLKKKKQTKLGRRT